MLKYPVTFAMVLFLLVTQTAMAIEEPEYEVVAEREDYEIRRYDPYIVAEVDVDGDRSAAGNRAFRILAGYIFGDNEPGEKMQMTAPVESRPEATGTRMQMTAPVEARAADAAEDGYTYAFVMERRYTLATLPKPRDPRIRLVERPQRMLAARRYSGRWTDANDAAEEAALLAALAADGVPTAGQPMLARYNPPFTPWFMRRNEVLVEVDYTPPNH